MSDKMGHKGLTTAVGVICQKNYFLYVVAFAYFLSQAGIFLIKGGYLNMPLGFFAGLDVLSLTIAAFVHGIRRYGTIKMLVFFVITLVVSWCMESASIAYGFPFGDYYYSDFLVPKLGAVPIIIMPAYFSMGYISWIIGLILTGSFDKKISGSALFTVPLISAFLMTSYDLCFDPVASTILKHWTWRDGGYYFGVPYMNFLGWYLTVYIIFQLFAYYLLKSPQDEPVNTSKEFDWAFPVLIFFITGLNFLFTPLIANDNPDIHHSLSLVTLFTMIFSSILAYINVRTKFGK